MFNANHKTSIIAAIAAVCIGLAGTDLVTQNLAKEDLKEQFSENNNSKSIEMEASVIKNSKAVYFGGKEAMSEDLSKSFISLVDESEMNAEGNVLVRFTIEADGSVGSIAIIRSISPAMNSAVHAAVLGLSKWEPAIQDGVAIKSKVVIPFKITQ